MPTGRGWDTCRPGGLAGVWKVVIGVEVAVETALALPLVKELVVLVTEEALVVEELVVVTAALAGAVEEEVDLDVAVATVEVALAVVVVTVAIGACVFAGEGRMGRP